jgi:hypothetical protein
VRNRRIESAGPSRERRDDGVDTRPVAEPGVHHRTRFVDPPADRAHDPLDNPQQVAVILEHDVGLLEPAVPLDVDLVEPVDQDVGNVRIAEQRLERTESEQLVQHVADEALPLQQAERRRSRFIADHFHDEIADLGLGLLAGDAVQALEIQAIQELLVDPGLQLLIVALSGVRAASSGCSKDGIHRVCLL